MAKFPRQAVLEKPLSGKRRGPDVGGGGRVTRIKKEN